MKKRIQFLCVCFLLGSCNYGPREDVDTSTESYAEKLNIYNFVFQLDTLTVNHYERGIGTFFNDSTFLIASYNKFTHSIDWFDIHKEEFFFRTNLDRQGPNEITEQVDGIYIHSMDTIFLNDGVFLYMINKDGKVDRKIQNYFETELGPTYMVNKTTSTLHYCSERKRLISEALVPGNRNLLFLEIGLNDEEIKLHQVKISKCYTRHDNQRHFISVSFKGDSIIYNSSCSSEIFVYDVLNNTASVFTGKSKLSKNIVSQIKTDNPNVLWKHIIENPRFFRVVYSPLDRKYYRLHWKEIDYNPDQNPNSMAFDKPIVLSVFSEDFRLVFETILPENQYLVDFLVSTPNGVMLNASHPNSATNGFETMELRLLRLN